MIINQFVGAFEPYSSIRTDVLCISKGAEERGHTVIIHTTFPPYRGKSIYYEDISRNIKVIHYPYAFRIRKFNISLHMLRVRKLPDGILHAHGYRAFETFCASKIKDLCNMPLVLSTYGSVPYVYDLKSKILKLLQDVITRRYPLKKADIILAETCFEKKFLIKLGVPADKIRVIYEKVDIKVFHKRHDILLNGLPRDVYQDKIILFVGRINRIKGIDILIRAFSLLPKHLVETSCVVLIGPCEDRSYLNYLRRLSKKLGVSHKVFYLGPMRHELLPRAYSAATVTVLPSRYENIGGVLIEAQACECPVIASNIGGIREVIIEGKTGFLFSINNENEGVNDLSEKLKRILTDEGLRNKMAKQARRYVLERFSVEKYVERVLEVYRSLV